MRRGILFLFLLLCERSRKRVIWQVDPTDISYIHSKKNLEQSSTDLQNFLSLDNSAGSISGSSRFSRAFTAQENLPRAQVAQAHNAKRYIVPFFYFYVNVQGNVSYGIYYFITTELDYAKRHCRLAAYGGVVLQRFAFTIEARSERRFQVFRIH